MKDFGREKRAIEVGEPYEGVPEKLEIQCKSLYVQPWSSFEPALQQGGQDLPIQKANIKECNRYDEIEVHGNRWIELACEEAKLAVTAGGGPFGAVLLQVDDETKEVIRYWKTHNLVTCLSDPTAHAEVMAIRAACRQLGVIDLGCIKKEESKMSQAGKTSHCELYSSAEPCPMCFGAIGWGRIPVLVFAATRKDTAQEGVDFSDNDIAEAMQKPYREQKIIVRQATTSNSLDSFNLWKRSGKVPY